MSEQARPTPGPVRVWPNDITGHCEILPEGAAGPVIARVNPFSAQSEGQGWADAHLIADAFTVHHETGLTPRELAEQRAELLEALEVFMGRDARFTVAVGGNPGAVQAMLDRANSIIAKARGGGA